jgi:hypothetical protein
MYIFGRKMYIILYVIESILRIYIIIFHLDKYQLNVKY